MIKVVKFGEELLADAVQIKRQERSFFQRNQDVTLYRLLRESVFPTTPR